jgi:hypothetical protein
MTTTTVTPATLAAALAAAKPGDTLSLGGGAYGDVVFRRPGVTLSGPKNAVLNSLTIMSPAANVVVEGFTVDLTPTAATITSTGVVRAVNMSGVTIRDLTITGGPAVKGCAQTALAGAQSAFGGNVLGLPTATGIVMDGVSNWSVDGCSISKLFAGITTCGENFQITNNEIFDLRTSPIHGTVWGDATIIGNYLHDSTPWNFGGSGDHGDYIHLWTDPAKSSAPIANVVITGNHIEQGAGGQMLGINLQATPQAATGLGFAAPVIDGNLILSGHAEGIRTEAAAGVAITDNILLQTSGGPKDAPSILPTYGSTPILQRNLAVDLYGYMASDRSNIIIPTGTVIAPWMLAVARAQFAANSAAA